MLISVQPGVDAVRIELRLEYFVTFPLSDSEGGFPGTSIVNMDITLHTICHNMLGHTVSYKISCTMSLNASILSSLDPIWLQV